MPHTPHAVHVSFRAVLVQMDWGNHVCHTHHTQCTFPSDQFLSRWTGAIMYATHHMQYTRFLQSSSCPDGLGQSCMPHTPQQCMFPSDQFVSGWTEAIMYATHTCHTHHTQYTRFLQSSSCPDGLGQSCMPHTPQQCMFPSDQFVSRWTEAIMYATHTTHTTCSAHFLQTSSCPDGLRQSCMSHTPHAVHVSFRQVPVQMD